jgi:hypothetical protein
MNLTALNPALQILLAALVLAMCIALWVYIQKERTQKFRFKFGPEYDKAIAKYRDRWHAESKLQKRAERVAKFNIQLNPLASGAHQLNMTRFIVPIVLLSAPGFASAFSEVCDPAAVRGVYGFQLSGDTTISGDVKLAVSLGRIVLDGAGGLSGYSSVNFGGYFLGNPVTGTYEVRTDCSISWSLQDDSGALQHFGGIVSADAKRVQFSQTDGGAAKQGLMVKSADACGELDLHRAYALTVSGSIFPMEAGDTAQTLLLKGLAKVDTNGNLNLIPNGSEHEEVAGTVHVDADCFAQLDLSLPLPHLSAMKFRGILVDSGKEILGIETDPGTAVKIEMAVRD